MATKTYPQLDAQVDVEDADLLASYRGLGPLKKLPASTLRDYMWTGMPSTGMEFQQAGTGAGVQTMREKARQIICVEDFYLSTSDDYTAIQRGLDRLHTLGGGMLYFSQPSYSLTAQPVFDATNIEGTVHINGGGAKLTSSGAASCLRISGNTYTTGVSVSDFTVFHNGNTDALAGFAANGTARLSFERCYVLADASVTADYAGFLLDQTDPDDANTACFWTRFPGSGVRSTGGIVVPNGVTLDGGHNATDFHNFYLSGVVNGVKMTTPTGSTLPGINQPIANCVRLQGSWLEGVTNGVLVECGAQTSAPYGLVIDSRMETVSVILKINDATLNTLQPPIIWVQQALQDITTFTDLPTGILCQVINLRAFGTGYTNIVTNEGWRFRGVDNAYDALTVVPPNLNSGFTVNYVGSDSLKAFTARQISSSEFQLAALDSGAQRLVSNNVQGISRSNVVPKNIAGVSGALSSGSVTVTFPITEVNANFRVVVTPLASVAGRIWVSNKATTGFKINSTDNADTATFDWVVIHD